MGILNKHLISSPDMRLQLVDPLSVSVMFGQVSQHIKRQTSPNIQIPVNITYLRTIQSEFLQSAPINSQCP